jgi:hypothetical protein
MPQHVGGDHLGPSGRCTLTASSRQPRPDLRYCLASCVTTTTEPGASHGAELHHPGPRPGRRTGTRLATGQALLNPSAQLTDATDDMIFTQAQLSAQLAGSYPRVRLLATDNTALAPSGWGVDGLFPGTPGNPQPFTFFLPPALTLSPRPAPARPCSLPSATPMPTARRSCSPGRRCPAGSLARRRHSPGRRRGRRVRAGHALHQSFLRTERRLRGQHRRGRHARHQPQRGADHRLRPVRRRRRQ